MTEDLKKAYESASKLRQEMEQWLDQSKRMDPPSKHGGGEDEANYSLAWFPHYLVTGSEGVAEHFRYLRDQLGGWVERDCHHGYEGVAEGPPRDGTVSSLSTPLPRSLSGRRESGSASRGRRSSHRELG